MSSTTDQQVGQNIARLRGEMTQDELADLMKERGFRWSHTTVYNVEVGERPVRASELKELADIFHVTSIAQFFEGAEVTTVEKARRDVNEARLLAVNVLSDYYYKIGKELARARDDAGLLTGPDENSDDLDLVFDPKKQAMTLGWAKLLGTATSSGQNYDDFFALLDGEKDPEDCIWHVHHGWDSIGGSTPF